MENALHQSFSHPAPSQGRDRAESGPFETSSEVKKQAYTRPTAAPPSKTVTPIKTTGRQVNSTIIGAKKDPVSSTLRTGAAKTATRVQTTAHTRK